MTVLDEFMEFIFNLVKKNHKRPTYYNRLDLETLEYLSILPENPTRAGAVCLTPLPRISLLRYKNTKETIKGPVPNFSWIGLGSWGNVGVKGAYPL